MKKRKFLGAAAMCVMTAMLMCQQSVQVQAVQRKAALSMSACLLSEGDRLNLDVYGISESRGRYISRNKEVVSVSKTGVLKANKAGTAKVIWKKGTKKLVCNVVVVAAPKVSVSEIKMQVGDSRQISVDLAGNQELLVKCQSKNEKIAAVNDGKITGVSAGSTVVTVKIKGNKKVYQYHIAVKVMEQDETEDREDIKEDTEDKEQEEDRDTDKEQVSKSMAEQVAELVNQERSQRGLSPLTLDADLTACANIRAEELTELFSHTRPDGTVCFTVFNENGIRYSAAAENIAYGQSGPDKVMESWMNSSGHRANILSEDLGSIGVGYTVFQGTPYWVQLFTD